MKANAQPFRIRAAVQAIRLLGNVAPVRLVAASQVQVDPSPRLKVSDHAGFADAVTQVAFTTRAADAVAATDLYSLMGVLRLADGVPLADSRQLLGLLRPADAASVADAVLLRGTLATADAVAVADGASLLGRLAVADAAPMTDASAVLALLAIAESVAMADAAMPVLTPGYDFFARPGEIFVGATQPGSARMAGFS